MRVSLLGEYDDFVKLKKGTPKTGCPLHYLQRLFLAGAFQATHINNNYLKVNGEQLL